MFVLFKMTKKKILLISLIILCALLFVLFTVIGNNSSSGSAVPDGDTDDKRIAFLEQFGWEVLDEPVDSQVVTIPSQFDTVYTPYNEIQKAQGYNLEKYKGESVNYYTYEVTNYPGTDSKVYAHLLIYEGKIIGGDIAEAAMDGFMHGLDLADTGIVSEIPSTSSGETVNLETPL